MQNIFIQRAARGAQNPPASLLKKFAQTALKQLRIKDDELTIRIVTSTEMQRLNHTFRRQNKPTNVLSFPANGEMHLKVPILGDIVICAAVVNREAKAQRKLRDAHWAHMVVHGICHLTGLDHEQDEDAVVMEKIEIAIMKKLGFPNPYSQTIIGDKS